MRTLDPRTNVISSDHPIEDNGTPVTPDGADAVLRRKLTARQEDRIRGLIHKHLPDELGMAHALWNKFAVRDLIADRIGVRLPNTTLGAYLKRWGFVPEKVLRRAYNEQPTVIRLWVKRQYPLIAAQAKAEHGEIYWGDEAHPQGAIVHGREPADAITAPSTRTDHWAGGQTMISIVSNRGLACWMIQRGPINSRGLINLFQRSIEGRERKLFLIMPYSPIQENKAVINWLAERTHLMQVFSLPGREKDTARDNDLRSRSNGVIDPSTWNDLIGS